MNKITTLTIISILSFFSTAKAQRYESDTGILTEQKLPTTDAVISEPPNFSEQVNNTDKSSTREDLPKSDLKEYSDKPVLAPLHQENISPELDKALESNSYSERIKILFGIHYIFADEMTGNDASVSSGGTTLKGSSRTSLEKGLGLSLGLQTKNFTDYLSLEIGGFYDFPRKGIQSKVTLNGTSTVGDASGTSYSAYGLFTNIVCSADNQTFLILGINNHEPSFAGGDSTVERSDAGGTGWQIGVRHKVNEKLYLEGQYRSLVHDSHSWKSGINATSKNIKTDGFIISLKFGL